MPRFESVERNIRKVETFKDFVLLYVNSAKQGYDSVTFERVRGLDFKQFIFCYLLFSSTVDRLPCDDIPCIAFTGASRYYIFKFICIYNNLQLRCSSGKSCIFESLYGYQSTQITMASSR